MLIKHVIIIQFVFFLPLSCTDTNRNIDFNEKKILVAEKILVNEIFSPDFISKKGNCLIIASSKSDTMLYSYTLPSLDYLHKTGRKGQGPDEIQVFPMFCESPGSEYLYIWGYTPLKIKKFSIKHNGEFVLKGEYLLSTYETYNNMHIINDSIFIYYLPDDLTLKKYDLKKNEYLDEIKYKKDDHMESYYYSNRGTIAVNQSNIVYAYLYKKQIDIYDLHTCKKKITLSDGKKYSKPDLGSFDNPRYYINLYAGSNYFYALCKENKNTQQEEQDNYSLEVFNYDGIPIIKYEFDIAPFLFVIDENEGYIYGYNKIYEDYWLKYKIMQKLF